MKHDPTHPNFPAPINAISNRVAYVLRTLDETERIFESHEPSGSNPPLVRRELAKAQNSLALIVDYLHGPRAKELAKTQAIAGHLLRDENFLIAIAAAGYEGKSLGTPASPSETSETSDPDKRTVIQGGESVEVAISEDGETTTVKIVGPMPDLAKEESEEKPTPNPGKGWYRAKSVILDTKRGPKEWKDGDDHPLYVSFMPYGGDVVLAICKFPAMDNPWRYTRIRGDYQVEYPAGEQL